MSFDRSVADKVLVACGRCCCLCHKFCGTNIELHHIKQEADNGNDSLDNCIPLCFDCHAEVNHYNPRHPKGRKFSEAELKSHRDNWYAKIAGSPAFSYSVEHLRADQQLFLECREFLNQNYLTEFIRDHDFGDSFPMKSIDPLFRFFEFCQNPENEFIDADLEKLRADLYKCAGEFGRMIGLETFPVESHLSERWNRIEKRDDLSSFNECRARLNRKANEFYEAYARFIKQGKQKLGVR